MVRTPDKRRSPGAQAGLIIEPLDSAAVDHVFSCAHCSILIITRLLLRNNESRFSLPALDFSTEQILYIALAQMWCSVSSKQKEQLHYDQDIHAPSNIRITGMLRNLREFSEAFSCPPGSFMNPVQRCSFRQRSS
ncbi:Endothelin-converting enzyme [Araneus ventricosus]|uniref:Endothelin-converting enzyme n=1 Tax=Araneus ventricosus TaxID=182803 RepID=A0A4Y2H1I4_ARAVE|nr:Endothelin-converting enzyme [Araneus ventricosus]